MLPHLEVLGSGKIMPALILGFELRGERDWRRAPLAHLEDERTRAFLFEIDSQVGGHACMGAYALGYVLRLDGNASRARQPVEELVRGFHLMAEDPKLGVLTRDFPLLRDICATHGDRFSAHLLDQLNEYLAHWLDLPPLRLGIEAWLSFEAGPYRELLGGWRLLAVRPGTDALGEWDGPNEWHEERALDDDAWDELVRVGEGLRLGAPRLFLAWENSD